MKKIFKILTLNTLLILIVLFLLELFAYIFSIFELKKFYERINFKVQPNQYFYILKKMNYIDYYKKYVEPEFKVFSVKKTSKKPIVIFGCSFAYGYGLKDEDTFSYKLSEHTNRSVYNRAISGASIQQAILQVKEDSFYSNIPEPEYIIYVYHTNLHVPRLYAYKINSFDNLINYRMILKNNELVIKKEIPFLSNFYIYTMYDKFKNRNIYNGLFSKNDCNFVYEHFKKLRELLQNHWNNSKFVILFYDNSEYESQFDNDLIKILKDNNFIVLRTKDLTNTILGKEYQISEYDGHPNGKAWNIIVPQLSNKLKL